VPAAQGGLTAMHGLPSFVAEKLVPRTHALHTRFVAPEPMSDCPSPTGHLSHSVHESTEAEPELKTSLN
jgi:hypothetical protein